MTSPIVIEDDTIATVEAPEYGLYLPMPEEEPSSSAADGSFVYPDLPASAPTSKPTPIKGEVATTLLAASGLFGDEPAYTSILGRVKWQDSRKVYEDHYKESIDNRYQDTIEATRQIAAKGNEEWTRLALEEAQRQKQRLEKSGTATEQAREVAETALENVANAAGKTFDPTSYQARVKRAADNVAIRQLLASKIEKFEEESGVGTWAQEILVDTVPMWYNTKVAAAVARVGGDTMDVGEMAYNYDTYRKVVDKLSGMDKDEAALYITKLGDEIALSTNKLQAGKFLSQILKGYTDRDASTRAVFEVLNATIIGDVFSIARGVTRLGRKGLPSKALADVAGEDVAGRFVAGEMAEGGRAGASGLKPHEQAEAVTSFLDMPTIDPAKFKGGGAAAQQVLEEHTKALYKAAKERLISSGRTSDEAAEALAAIERKYSPAINPRIHSVQLGNPNELGVGVRAVWQAADGTPFQTKELAEAFARERGRNVEVVPATGNTGFYVREDEFQALVAKRDALAKKLEAEVSPIDRVSASIADGSWEQEAINEFVKKAPLEVGSAIKKEKALIAYLKKEGVLEFEQAAKVRFHENQLKQLEELQDIINNNSTAWGVPKERMPIKDVLSLENATERVQQLFALDPEALYRAGFFSKADLKNHLEWMKEQLAKSAIFDRSEKSLFDKSLKGFTQLQDLAVSDRLNKNVGPLVQDWRKLFGIGKGKLVVLHENDVVQNIERLAELSRYDELAQKAGQAPLLDEVAQGGWSGLHFGYGSGISRIDFIVMRGAWKTPNPRMMGQLAHELGHYFDSTVLRNNPALRKNLVDAFEKWMQSNYPETYKSQEAFRKWVDEFRTPLELVNEEGQRISYFGGTMADRGLPSGQIPWLGKFEEFWSEQFSKWALTKTPSTSLIGKHFQTLRDAIVAFYEKAASIFGKPFRTDPQRAVEDFLDTWTSGVQRDREALEKVEALFGISKSETDKVVKPHIKLKSEQAYLSNMNARIAAMAEEREAAATSSGWLVRESIDEPFSVHTVGKYDRKDIESMPFVSIDPKHGASELAVEERVIGVHAEAKLKNEMVGYLKPFWNPLSSKEKVAVHNVLVKGDSFSDLGGVGKEFNWTELTAEGLNDKQKMAYFAVRELRSFMHTLRDKEMVRSLRSQGYSETVIKLGEDDHFVSAGRKMDVNVLKNKSAYIPDEGKSVVLTEEKLQSYLDNGYVPIETLEKANVGDKSYTRFMVKPSDMHSRPIVSVLPKRPGEYSRIYTDHYFIKLNRETMVNDELTKAAEHIRTAPSKRLADEFASDLNGALALVREAQATGKELSVARISSMLDKHNISAKEWLTEVMEGKWDDVVSVESHYNRMQDDFINAYTNKAASEGQLFVSKRGERLPSVVKGEKNTLDVFDSISAEMSSTARFVNINAWKEASIQRWYNAFGHLVHGGTGDPVQDFFKFTSQKYVGADKETMFAQRTHKYISDQLAVSTSEENYYKAIAKQITEKWFSGNVPIETAGAAIRNSSLISFLRNANFHLNLGMFNPAQLLVQANGASTALLLHPVHGLKAAKTFPLLRMALMSDNPEVWGWFAKAQKLSDLGLSSKEEFVDLVKAIRKSGILDGIQSTSLYNIEDGRFNVFKGMAGKVGEQSPFFFNRGEEFSRVVAFDVARREWMASNPGKIWTSDRALKDIVIRQDDLTQNMTKANLAGFQRGVLSIPMQFAQYNVKLAANILSATFKQGSSHYRGFTRGEALQLMLGHMVLYGAAGNGAMFLLETVGDTMNQWDEETRTYFVQGALAGLLNSVALAFDKEEGMNVGLGSRLGTFDYYERIAKALFSDETKLWDALLGPTAGNARRLGVVGDVAKLMWYNPNLQAEDVLDGIQRITTEQITTLRNVSKAYLYYMHEGKMIDGKGNELAKVNKKEMLAQALGFAPSAAFDVTTLFNTRKEQTEALNDVANLLYSVQKQIVVERAKNTPEGDKRADELEVLRASLMPENIGDRMYVLNTIKEKVFPYDTVMHKLLAEYVMKGRRNQPVTSTAPAREGTNATE